MTWRDDTRNERLALRQLAQTVACPVCLIEAGLPCIGFEGKPNGRMDHVKRIEAAENAAAKAGAG